MARGVFRGGVHPPDRKSQTASRPIERMQLPGMLVVPMSQHLGAPASPLVSKGDRVERGQLIGEPQGFVSAAVHAPASGEVVDVRPVLTPAGIRVVGVVIAIDAAADPRAFVPIDVAGDDAAAAARAAGLVGLGGAAFPSAVKLSPPADCRIDTVILNGCECEPFLTCDHRVMVEHPDRVVAGARIIAGALHAPRVVIAVESNKPDAVKALVSVGDPLVEVAEVRTRYPQGAEKQLIATVTGRAVRPGRLPSSTGCVVHNVQTAAALADAVELHKPLIERVVTVSGAVRRPGNYLIALGTTAADLIEYAGGLREDAARVIAGGPFTAQPLGDLEVPVVKGTSGIIALTEKEAAPIVGSDQACIRCGRCVDACPMSLHPFAVADHSARRSWDVCQGLHVMDCIECGCCSFVCPARRPLLQLLRAAKGVVSAKGAK